MSTTALAPGSAGPTAYRTAARVARRSLFYLAMLVIIAVSLFPFYWILRTSLMSDTAVAQGVGGANGLLPTNLTFASYSDDFSQQHFLTPLLNSAIVALGTTAVTIIVPSGGPEPSSGSS